MDSLPISNPFPHALSYIVRETSSTQEEARRLARASFPSGSVVAAEIQSAGRGRFPERPWRSEPGLNLLFTLRLDASYAALPALPLRVGAALCRAAERQARGLGRGFRGGQARVKWPNDLLIDDRKAAGVLCEASAEGVFVGIGVNCNQAAFPPEIEGKATSLAIELGAEIDRWAFLELILGSIKAAFEMEEWKAEVEALLWRRGERVRFMPGLPRGGPGPEELVEGRLEGLDPSGAILIRPLGEAGRGPAAQAFAAGELLLR